ncbi:MAG: response regulator [Anaerolineales bacterium]|nr:response regulator [Anaerolineales bacterium]
MNNRSPNLSSQDQTAFENDGLIVVDDDIELTADSTQTDSTWKVLIVDDDQEVHDVTKLALRRLVFQDKGVEFLSAYSTSEAIDLLKTHTDIAVILLDVVMEEKDSGLKVTRFIRDDLKNHLVRIVLRTGQPGEAPEESVIIDYGINDYKTKSELTRRKLFTMIIAALRSYGDLITIERNRQELAILYADLRESHRQLQQAKANEEQANRVKSDFLRVMNHELRTPLNGIIGMSDILSEEIYGQLTEGQSRTVSILKRSANHLSDLIRDILEFANIEADTLQLKLKSVDATKVCQEAVQLVKQAADKKDVQISFEAEEEITLQADPIRLKQILINLLDNAIKFTPSGGQMGLKLQTLAPQQQVEFIVWDTGIGFDTATLENLFKPFVQADSSNTRHHEGLGIGLTLADRLVKMHRGTITVESRKGQGSCFTVLLPWQT